MTRLKLAALYFAVTVAVSACGLAVLAMIPDRLLPYATLGVLMYGVAVGCWIMAGREGRDDV